MNETTTLKQLIRAAAALLIFFLMSNTSSYGQCPKPKIYGDTVVCSGDKYYYTYYTNKLPNVKYRWRESNGNVVSTSSDTMVVINWNDVTKYGSGSLSLDVWKLDSPTCYESSRVIVHSVLMEPEIIKVDGPPGMHCRGKTFTYALSSPIKGVKYNVTSQNGTINYFKNDTLNITWPDLHAGAFKVSAEKGSCKDTFEFSYYLDYVKTNFHDITICEGSLAIFTQPTTTGITYKLIGPYGKDTQFVSGYDSETKVLFTPSDSGRYIMRSSHWMNQCEWVDTFHIYFTPGDPRPDLGPDTTVCNGDTVTVGVPAEAGFTYSWYYNHRYFDRQPFANTSYISVKASAYPGWVYLHKSKAGCIYADTIRFHDEIPAFYVRREEICYYASISSARNGQVVRYFIQGGNNIPVDTTKFKYTWSVDNGTIIKIFSDQSIEVRWSDTASKGRLVLDVATNRCSIKAGWVDVLITPAIPTFELHGQTVCKGAEISYKMPEGYKDYYTQWWREGPNGIDSFWAPDSLNIKASETYVYGLRVVDCYTATELLDTFIITVLDSNACECGGTELNFDLPNFKKCKGLPISYEAPDRYRGSNYTYRWWRKTGSSSDTFAVDTVSVEFVPQSGLIYGLTIRDTAGNCQGTDTFVVIVDSTSCQCDPQNNITSQYYEDTACQYYSIQIHAPQGGDRYTWQGMLGLIDTTSKDPWVVALATKTYYVWVESDTGCNYLDSVKIIVNESCGAISQYYIDTVCAGDSVQLQSPIGVNAIGWLDGQGIADTALASPWITPTVSRTYYVLAMVDSAIYIDSVRVIVDTACVWPGDANLNLKAEITDLLNIGIAYGKKGFARPGGDTTWRAQHVQDWGYSFNSGVNVKHADCDGDGEVDSFDVQPLSIHFGKTHSKTLGKHGKKGDPELYFIFSQDSVAAGDSVSVFMMLGRDSIVKNIYGIAFQLDFSMDEVVVQKKDFSQSWIGSPSQTISLIHYDSANSRLTVGIVRIDQKNVSGKGQIGRLSIVMPDNIGGKRAIYDTLMITPKNVVMIDAGENIIPVYTTNGELVVYDLTTNIETMTGSGTIHVYPNPVDHMLNIVSEDIIREVRVYNLLGGEVYKLSPQKKTAAINTEALPAGMYSVQITTDKGIESVKVLRK